MTRMQMYKLMWTAMYMPVHDEGRMQCLVCYGDLD